MDSHVLSIQSNRYFIDLIKLHGYGYKFIQTKRRK